MSGRYTVELDVVYTLKEEDDNEELRYSLRSLAANMPHNNVFFAGYMPTWVRNVYHIPVEQDKGSKYLNSRANIMAACHSPEVTNDFILMNDDFFILQPTDYLEWHFRDTLDKVIQTFALHGNGPYLRGMKRTKQILEDLGQAVHGPIKSYELHIPMVFNKRKRILTVELQELVNPNQDLFHSNTIYGNFWSMGGRRMKDVKIYDEKSLPPQNAQFLSTDDMSFKRGKVGEFVREKFPLRCIYER